MIYIDIETSSPQQEAWLTEYWLNKSLKPRERISLRAKINNCKDALNPHKGKIVHVGWINTSDLKVNMGKGEYIRLIPDPIGHNVKFDLGFLFRNCPQEVPLPTWDTQLAAQLLQEPKTSLGDLVSSFFGIKLDKSLEWRLGPWHIIDQLKPEDQETLKNYLINDVKYLPELHKIQQKQIEEQGLSKVMDMEMKLIPVLTRMELNGLTIHRDRFVKYQTKTINEMNEVRDILFKELNFKNEKGLNSPKQLKQALKEYGIIVTKTDEKTLSKIDHPICKNILRYRELNKLSGTYFQGMIDSSYDYWDCKPTFTIIGQFKQLGAKTGRITSDMLQVFPKTKEFRSMFVPSSPNKVLVRLDMDQIEPRILGQYVGPGKYREMLFDSPDVYGSIAKGCFNKEIKKGDKERDYMKAIILGIMYDKQPSSIAQDLGITLQEAEQAFNLFFKTFPEVKKWVNKMVKNLEVALPSGRRRTIVKEEAKRTWKGVVINTYIQGAAADANKDSLINLDSELDYNNGELLLLTLHDEIMGECYRKDAKKAKALMENMFKTIHEKHFPDVPIACEAEILESWGDCI